jgi:hypothetical protein
MRTSTLSHANLQSKAGGDEVRAEGVIRRTLPPGYWSLRDGLLEAYKTESGLLVGCSPVALVSTRAESTAQAHHGPGPGFHKTTR